MGVLGSIFGFGDSLKRRLRDAVSNPSDYATMTTDQNQREWNRNPDERSMGFFNPVPLGTMGNFALRKELADALPSLSRREFMKKSAGLAGGTAAAAIPGAKLLSKFAPEEKQLVKEATSKQVAIETAPKYKYNSLKDYLDDISSQTERNMIDNFDSPGTFGPPGSEPFETAANHWEQELRKGTKNRLLDDEATYKNAKDSLKYGLEYHPNGDVTLSRNHPTDAGTRLDPQTIRELSSVDHFSPQAKKEMKEFKELSVKHGTPWEEALPRMNDIGSWW